nr:hypothetical protein [Tanacetum cinerariifolium]
MLQPDGTVLTYEMMLNVVFLVLLRWDYDKECGKLVDLLSGFGVLRLFPDSVSLTMLVTRFLSLCSKLDGSGYKKGGAVEEDGGGGGGVVVG